MIDLPGLDAKLAYLKKIGAEHQPHSGRTLYQHLLGTAALLEQWGCSATVRDVGLMHSARGTRFFRWAPRSIDVRGDLAALLDENALRLIELFSAIRRGDALLDAWESSRMMLLQDDALEREVSISRPDLSALILVECANLVDQGRGRSFIVRLLGRPWSDGVLGAKAKDFLERYRQSTAVALPTFSGGEFSHGYLLQRDSGLAASIRGHLAPPSSIGFGAAAERWLVRALMES